MCSRRVSNAWEAVPCLITLAAPFCAALADFMLVRGGPETGTVSGLGVLGQSGVPKIPTTAEAEAAAEEEEEMMDEMAESRGAVGVATGCASRRKAADQAGGEIAA